MLNVYSGRCTQLHLASCQACHLTKLKESNISHEHNTLLVETAQLAIYKHDRRDELGSTEKQLQLSGDWSERDLTRDLSIPSPAP